MIWSVAQALGVTPCGVLIIWICGLATVRALHAMAAHCTERDADRELPRAIARHVERETWADAAGERPVSEWAREVLNRAARRAARGLKAPQGGWD